MIEYLQSLAIKGNIDMVSITITPSGITYSMNKQDYELSHKYSYEALDSLYDKDYAVKSDLEQMAIDLCRVASEGGKDGSYNTAEEDASNKER